MPELIKLYIRSCLIGFGIAAIFVAAIVCLDVANLGHLVFQSSDGVLAVVVLWVLNGIVFAGVQFGIAIMQLADDTPTKGRGFGVVLRALVPVSKGSR
jgi:hypothetical protein